MAKDFGDALAIEIAKWIHEPLASTTKLTAIPASDRVDLMIVGIGSSTPIVAVFLDGSTAAASSSVLVPDDVAASAEYVADPTTAPGRYHVLGTNPDVMEFGNPLAASTTGLRAATATVVAPSTAALLQAGLDELNAHPRQIVLSTAGSTASDAPATATITGKDFLGNVQTETINVSQTAASVTSTKFYRGSDLVITFPPADGTGATIAIGWGAKLGLKWKPRVRQGSVMVVTEYEAGARVLTGTFVIPATDIPFGSYTPANAANGTRDYVLFVERDYT